MSERERALSDALFPKLTRPGLESWGPISVVSGPIGTIDSFVKSHGPHECVRTISGRSPTES